ncbi:DNA-formamidopyrimidine glycosylase, partial [Arthrobacter deserti]|nr:DNA-formamidopyrimidine glycosylase [Arthrobacter deserti]
MPELPEVEVVRRGLARWVGGRTITGVEVLDGRSVRRHALGAEALRGNLVGARVEDVARRGKFLWMPLTEASSGRSTEPRLALMAHLGMSGQLLIEDSSQPDEKHLKVRFTLSPAA